jgi:hypothetical protein
MSIEQVKHKFESWLLGLPHVVGVGIGYKYVNGKPTNEIAVVVFVDKKVPKHLLKPEHVVPESLEGFKTDVREKYFRAFYSPEDKQKRWRPVPGGVSIGHYRITAGTLGCVVTDKTDGEKVILSNNHVLANCNEAEIGDPILQPGPYDGGKLFDDAVGKLKRFVPIQFAEDSTCPISKTVCKIFNRLAKLAGSKARLTVIRDVSNTVDCAIASPTADVDGNILDIGTPTGVADGFLGMEVRKSGRTTCLTEGRIDTVNLTVRVSYGSKTALFVNQIGIQPKEGKFSAGGDSGSAILFGDKLVGLLFAGDETGYTIGNKIIDVFNALNVGL